MRQYDAPRTPRRPARGDVRRLASLCIAAACVFGLTGCRESSIADREPEAIIGGHGFGPDEFHRPRAIATAPDGWFFVVDMRAKIRRFSPDGEPEAAWQTPEMKAGKPTGITVDATGRVLVADTHYSRVLIYDRDGNELNRFGTYGTGDGQFLLPTAVLIDNEGFVYVSEYGGNDRVSRFSPEPELKFLGSFGGPDAGEASLSRPQAMVLDQDNTILVADAVHHRIGRFSREGELLGTIGTAGREVGQLQYPYDLAVCDDGTYLICEYGNNRIQRFDRNGNGLETWGTPGRGPGQLIDAWGVAIGADRRVYVVDSRNHRVQLFRM